MPKLECVDVAALMEEILTLLEDESSCGVEKLADETDLEVNEMREILTTLERMGLVQNLVRLTKFGLKTLELPEGSKG